MKYRADSSKNGLAEKALVMVTFISVDNARASVVM